MGIIQKQTIKGSIFAYLGAFLGFITTVLLMPRLITEEEIGLLRVLVSVSVLFAQFAGLGFGAASNRFFPYFRDDRKNHNGFLFLAAMVSLAGFLVCAGLFGLFRSQIIEHYQKQSPLLIDYLYCVLPLSFFTIFFGVFDTMLRVLYNATLGTFLKDFFQRALILVILGCYALGWMSFSWFVIAYIASMCLPTLILMLNLYLNKMLDFRPNLKFITKDMGRQIAKVSTFAILSGFSFLLIANIDMLMINEILGLKDTGIYGVVFYFGTIILIPSRSLYRISTTVIAEAWKNNELNTIKTIYSKSCLNQMIVGCLIFIGIWANIENVFHMLPSAYAGGKYVILFVSLANLAEVATGVNGIILATSRYYKYDTYFMLMLMGVVVLANLLLIPVWGINGAAAATLFSVTMFNLARFAILYMKYGMQPYHISHVKVLGIAVLVLLIGIELPEMPGYFLIDLAIRSMLITVIFVTFIYLSKVSAEANTLIDKYLLFRKRNLSS